MQELEFAFMLIVWEEILQHFHRVSQALQNKHVNLKSCIDLYSSLADYLHASRNEWKKIEEAVKEVIPGVDYKATLTLKRKRKKVVNDGDAPEESLNARDKCCISTFYLIIDNPKAEMSRRGQVHNDIADRFYCLVNVPETSSTNEIVQYSECCEELINPIQKI